MEIITNYTPKFYFQDELDDSGWGCGWRCIQMLLSQLGIDKDIFTIAFEVSELIGEGVNIDFDNRKINMADTYWILLYMCNVCHMMGASEANMEMFTVESTTMLNELSERLQTHFLTQKSLVVVTAGGATALISGIKSNESGSFDVYLIDPHTSSLDVNFEELKGFGKGGRGWIDIRDIILKGMDEIGIDNDDEFLVNSSCLFGFLQNSC